ncbi:MAG: site-specific DNA-methyltransferase [Candidatus Staskawiczbacteria bacterium]|nr:site-specific DNA-methyltransferase [Candidatus Staskawiczbacteria bacterium]
MAKVKVKNKKALRLAKEKLRGVVSLSKTKHGIIAKKWPRKKSKKALYEIQKEIIKSKLSKNQGVKDAVLEELVETKKHTQPDVTATNHKLIVGNCMSMAEIPDGSVHLMITSPPYFNAPFDYKGLFKSYEQYLGVLKSFAEETYRVLQDGRIAVLNIDDMLIDGEKYPIAADAVKIFQQAGFRYRDKIVWKKPDGYLRISRRSGVILQNPYPMYFYPDNLLESIVIFQKGRFDYRSISKDVREKSKVDTKEIQKNRWYMTLWEMNNVMPGSSLEKDIAAFPEELPYRAIKLFSYKNETVLDPFAGSGTTMKKARELGRNSIGFEIKKSLVSTIKTKLGFGDAQKTFFANQNDKLEIIYREADKYGYIS